MPVLRENDEMMYQFENDYRFDSSKVEAALGLQPTSYREGIAASLGPDQVRGAESRHAPAAREVDSFVQRRSAKGNE